MKSSESGYRRCVRLFSIEHGVHRCAGMLGNSRRMCLSTANCVSSKWRWHRRVREPGRLETNCSLQNPGRITLSSRNASGRPKNASAKPSTQSKGIGTGFASKLPPNDFLMTSRLGILPLSCSMSSGAYWESQNLPRATGSKVKITTGRGC